MTKLTDAEMKTMGDLIHSKRKENERLQEHADNLERQLEQMTDNRDEMKQKRNKWYADAYELRKERDEWKAKTEQAQAKLNDIDRYGTQNERDKAKVKYTDAYQTYHSAGDEAEAYCPKCDANLSYDEYTYCPWCGSELDWEPEPKTENDEMPVDEIPFYTAQEDSEMSIDELISFLREAPDHCWTRESELRMADEVERVRKENERLKHFKNATEILARSEDLKVIEERVEASE